MVVPLPASTGRESAAVLGTVQIAPAGQVYVCVSGAWDGHRHDRARWAQVWLPACGAALVCMTPGCSAEVYQEPLAYRAFDHCNMCWPKVVDGKVFTTREGGVRYELTLCPVHYARYRECAQATGLQMPDYDALPVRRQGGRWID